jgi:intracellular sulfur oxidation DsrE/DsrF family protein
MLKTAAKWSALLVALMLTLGGLQSAFAADKPFAEKKIVLQISDPNPFKQTLVLNVANNLVKEYGPDKVDIQIVAFGPGVRLLFADNANTGRIKNLVDNAGVGFHACSNTIKNMTKKLGEAPEINPLATKDSPGVVQIVNLVSKGFILVKP